MSENQSKPVFFITCFLPVLLLISLDSFALYLQGQSKAISHFSFAVFVAQLLCILVCHKGEICNGQRSRLIKVNNYFLIYWIFWLLLSLFSNYHYVLTDMLCLCGIGTTLAIYFQPAEVQLRKSILLFATLFAALGIVLYGLIFTQLSWVALLPYSPFGQILLGVILANLVLVISKNRLQGFIALLPLIMIVCLLLNAIFSVLLVYLALQSAVIFANELALGLYFLLHLVLMVIIAFPIIKQTKLSYQTLLLLFFITASLPIWTNFAFLK
ncbi:hypothetical protein ACLS0M_03515 [Avibacterium avium]|uniref:hypothetical protein n=1 Tax=Avibacterium avium TaxID=751 RepID=UPI003BF864E8